VLATPPDIICYNQALSALSFLHVRSRTMATNDTHTPLPNPFTPLAFLPPSLAGQFEVVTYVYLVTLSVSTFPSTPSFVLINPSKAFSWDWLMSIQEEAKMCRQRKFGVAIIAYFLSRCDSRHTNRYKNPRSESSSRIGTLAYCTSTVVLQSQFVY
jgi:hypothetical protein